MAALELFCDCSGEILSRAAYKLIPGNSIDIKTSQHHIEALDLRIPAEHLNTSSQHKHGHSLFLSQSQPAAPIIKGEPAIHSNKLEPSVYEQPDPMHIVVGAIEQADQQIGLDFVKSLQKIESGECWGLRRWRGRKMRGNGEIVGGFVEYGEVACHCVRVDVHPCMLLICS